MNITLYFSISLTSAAVIAFQITLMQVLSITQWNHFAFMIISLALLGFGTAGTVLSIFKYWFVEYRSTIIPLTMILTGIFILLSVPLSQTDFARFDTFLLFAETSHIFKIVFTYIIFFIPFFFAGLAIGLIYVSYAESIGKLYFSDLLGAGIGGLGVVILFWFMYSAFFPIVISILPIAAGVIQIRKDKKLLPFIAVSLWAFIFIVSLIYPIGIKSSQYKSISKTLNLPDAEIELEKNSPFGFIQVVKSNLIRHAPGLSLTYTNEIPVRKAVFNNGDWFGPIISRDTNYSNFVLNYTIDELVYRLAEKNNILILDSRTGKDIIHALTHNAVIIRAVESNIAINSLLYNELADETDSIYYKKNVDVFEISSRTFLNTDTNFYDIILLPPIGSFGGSAGTQAIKEDFLFTVESFNLMFGRLKENGFIQVTCWMDYPFRNPLRILATIIEALELSGINNVEEHIVSIRSWSSISFLIKKKELNNSDIEAVRNFCNEMNFDTVVLPGISLEERTQFNQLQDEKFFSYIDSILSKGREDFLKEYSFRIFPPTDNNPYFSQFLKWENIPDLQYFFGTGAIPFFELGYLIVLLTFFQITLISIILVILPLIKLGWRGANKLWTVLYFSGLGAGYMLIEIALIQKFVLYFGNPIYSAAAVISFMLICSGLGSYISSFVNNKSKGIISSVLIIIFLLITYTVALNPLLQNSIHYSTVIKGLISFVLIGLPAFVMGFPFPTGINKLSENNKQQIPWAWGINACFSVISAVLAIVIAVEFGFDAVFFTAVLAYCVTLISTILFGRKYFS